MPKNVIITDAANLAAVPLPSHGSSYTVVSHKFIIDKALAELTANGFVIDKEEYCRNLNGEVALGVYHLQYGNDPDMGLMFTWANSYDKSMRFRCAIGGYTHLSNARLIAGDMSNYGRVHTGDAKDQVEKHIESQIQSAGSYFATLVKDKDEMKTITLTDTQVAELMGVLYFEKEILGSSQLINVKDEHKKPSFTYTTAADNLWTIYNHCIVGLKKAHPKSWMEQQKGLHAIVKDRYMAVAPVVVNPNQTDLLDQIDEIEAISKGDVNNFSGPPVIEDVPTLTLEAYTEEKSEITDEIEVAAEEILEVIPMEDTDIDAEELLESDASVDAVQDPNALTLKAHDAKPEEQPEVKEEESSEEPIITKEIPPEQSPEFPETPADLPVSDEIIPLEEQVASEIIQPVSEEEKKISKEPVVDEPEKEENLDWLEEGPVKTDKVFDPEPESKSQVKDPFEF